MMSVFGVETRVVYEIDAASDDVTRGEGGSVRLTRARGAEGVTVVAVVTVRVLVPAGQAVHIHPLRRQTDSHVSGSRGQ